MNRNLLIVGAGIYSLVAKEIAQDMGIFEGIGFVDDNAQAAPDGTSVCGTIADIKRFSSRYSNVVVAIGNPTVRLRLIRELSEISEVEIATLISPRAYVSPSASVGKGSIIEPMAVVHAGCTLEEGCIVSAGAVVNHFSMLGAGVHIDCNAVVAGNMVVPKGHKVCSGEVYSQNT